MEGERTEDPRGIREDAPEISGGLERGRFVSVSARIGNDLVGYVCDRDEIGLLLDVRDPSGDPAGYEFMPWQSIERVMIE
ncbi:MAG: hypothetical protein M3157_04815 [Actinomycetota bacterium]|nr:hypothetical protein [Actinomycetota bacterium]